MNVKRAKQCLYRHLLILAGLLVTMATSAQQLTVRGTVKDAAGEAIIGANVTVKGTTNGTITDIDGNYSVSGVSPSSVLVFSFIGYKNQEVACKGQQEINVILTEDLQALDEVVVVGYGSLSKKELSSSIVQVDKSKFQQGAMNNPMEMLTGKVAGLNVVNTASANPNAGSSLQIRGATSLTASNDPLIVIDGVAGGDIRNLASQDIESMTVLKDAGSAAIYGTRGANGVILITTKKGSGEPGTAKVTYDSWFGMNLAKPGPDILSPDEFRRSRRGTDYGDATDWYGLLMRDFSYDNNQYVSIDGSTKNGYYSASFNYKKATGLDLASSREEYGGRFAIEQRVIDNRLQLNGSLNARRVNETWGNDGMFDTALSMNPTMPLYDDNGNYYQPTSPTGARNPVAELTDIDNNGQRMYVLGTAEAKLNILRSERQSLNTSLSYSLHYNDLKQHYFTPSTSGESYQYGYKGRAEVTYQKWYTQRLEWLGNYSLDLNDHSIKAVGGYTYEESRWERVQASNSDFAYDNLKWHDIGSGSFLKEGKAGMNTGQSIAKLIGVFGRVNYNWKDLLMASAAIRYEGSTKFGKDHKWGAFPSVSLAWEVANMNFMKKASNVVNSLKPRISYGVTGRSDFDSYLSLATYSTNGSYLMGESWMNGYAPSVNANPELGWEKGISTNVGVDFVLFKNRLRGSIDWFDRQSKDLLYRYTAPQPPFVYKNLLVNVGTTQNRGFELTVEGDIFKGTKVEWTSGINYSYGTTKLKVLSNDIYKASYIELYQKPGVGSSEHFFRVQEGGKVGQFFGYEYAGVENGTMMVYTDQGEVVPIADAEKMGDQYKRYIGNGTPTSYLSWSNTLRYKNFDLSIFFRGAFGFEIFNMRKYGMGLQGCGTANVLRDAYLKDKDMVTGGGVISSFFLEKGDYVKLENVTLGYNFTPKPNKILDGMRVFVSAKNLFTLTGYSGNDPSIVPVNGLTPGVDTNSAYPSATQLSVGVTLRFK